MKNLTVILSLENKTNGLEKVLNSVHKKVYEPCYYIKTVACVVLTASSKSL